jgi:hypothetical protein
MKVIDDAIAGHRKTIQSSLKGTKNLKKTHKEIGAPWTKEMDDLGTATRKASRFFVKYLTNIRNEMRKAAHNINRKDIP